MTTTATQQQNQQQNMAGLMAPAATTTTTGGNYSITPSAPTATQATQATQPTAAPQPSAVATTSQPSTSAPQPAAPAIPKPAPITGAATVEGRLDNLLKSDSPYMKAAEQSALQGMNRRGLMQSTIAVGAAHEAAIRSALPIAQQDAQNEFQQQNTYQLHQYDIGKTDKAGQVDNQKSYLTLAAAANDRYAQEFSNIQRSEMTAAQKTVAVEELKKWKVAHDAWLNGTMASFSGSQIDMGPFTGGGTGATPPASTGTQPGGAYASLSAAASLPFEQQAVALKSAGVPQAAIDAANKYNWPLFKEGKYLSGYKPAGAISMPGKDIFYSAAPKYTELPK